MATTSQTQPQGLTINKGLPRQLFNRFVTGILRSPLHGLAGFSKFGMLLTYTGRKSGKKYTLPLAYMREGDTITTFALFTNTMWWKNLRNDAQVLVRVGGRDYNGIATVSEDPQIVAEGLRKMFEQNPAMTQRGYYAVPRTSTGQIDEEALLATARTRVMIEITLSPRQEQAREFSPRMKAVMRAFTATHVALYRLSRGAIGGRMGTASVLLLTTTGRKTGKKYTTPLNYQMDGDRYVIIGSMGGSPKNPTWVLNLRSNPAVGVQVRGRSMQLQAQIAQGTERERIWLQFAAHIPHFAELQQRTSRQFPVIVLSEQD